MVDKETRLVRSDEGTSGYGGAAKDSHKTTKLWIPIDFSGGHGHSANSEHNHASSAGLKEATHGTVTSTCWTRIVSNANA